MKKWYKALWTKQCLPLDTRQESLIEKETQALIDLLEIQKGTKVLDLCFFTGRHLLKLAERGYDIEGLDLSKDYCEYVKQKLVKRNLKKNLYNLYNIDMRKMKFENKYDAIYSLFTSFGYFEETDNIKVLYNIYDSLKTGGKFLLDQVAKTSILKRNEPWIEVKETLDPNILFIYHNYFDYEADRYKGHYIFCYRKPFKVNCFEFSVKLYEKEEIENYLTDIGFKIKKTLGGWDKSRYTRNSKRMILIAGKR